MEDDFEVPSLTHIFLEHVWAIVLFKEYLDMSGKR